MDSLLSLSGITKTYPGVRALDNVGFSVRAGEIHALIGENGAGKSTLIGVTMGVTRPDSGTYVFAGREVHSLTPASAMKLGIAAVFQEFALAPELTVLENLFLGRERTRSGLLDRTGMRAAAQGVLETIGFQLNLQAKVKTLSRAEQQMVEIARAMLHDVRLLILDEPTASLTETDADRLLQLLRRMRDRGVAIVYVSHRLGELLALADRISVLRDGTFVTCAQAGGMTERRLVELMSGRSVDVQFPSIEHRPGGVLLAVEDLTSKAVQQATFHVRSGEVVGIAGLVGCGKSELIRTIYGAAEMHAGRLSVRDTPIEKPTPASMLARGVAYFPADRNSDGLALNRAIYENVTLACLNTAGFVRRGWIDRSAETAQSLDIMRTLGLRPIRVAPKVETLSGGNRQKVMLGRGLARPVSIFLFDEPTVGIDVGAKLEVYAFIKQLAERGCAVVIVSSELSEVMGLAHRLYVMAHGRIIKEHSMAERPTEDEVLQGFFAPDADENLAEVGQ